MQRIRAGQPGEEGGQGGDQHRTLFLVKGFEATQTLFKHMAEWFAPFVRFQVQAGEQ